MLNAIIDNLSLLDKLGDYVFSIIQLGIIFIWILLTRKSSRRYQMSLMIALILLLVSILTFILTIKSAAYIIGVYAFLFLGIGILQSMFSD